jgi:hypothetical protein
MPPIAVLERPLGQTQKNPAATPGKAQQAPPGKRREKPVKDLVLPGLALTREPARAETLKGRSRHKDTPSKPEIPPGKRRPGLTSADRKQIGIRLSPKHHRIAKALALPDGLPVTKVLEPILEEALNGLTVEAERVAQALLDDLDTDDDGDETKSTTNEAQRSAGYRQISLRISLESFTVAQALAYTAGSVPKVCEPLLERELENRHREATKAAQELVRQLKQQRHPIKTP